MSIAASISHLNPDSIASDDPPMCSHEKCKGTSNLKEKMGICGLSSFTDCSCINDCPPTPKKCGDCGGFNNPDGSESTCLTGPNSGCPCTSSCAKGKCDELDGCKGFNDPAANSTCTVRALVSLLHTWIQQRGLLFSQRRSIVSERIKFTSGTHRVDPSNDC